MDQHDVCECGDYRSSHPNGTGPCGVCAWSRAPYDNCSRFRFAYSREPLLYLTRDENDDLTYE